MENVDQKNVVSIALTASDISILSRVNADVTNIPDVKYATWKTRPEKRELKNKKMVDGDGGLVV